VHFETLNGWPFAAQEKLHPSRQAVGLAILNGENIFDAYLIVTKAEPTHFEAQCALDTYLEFAVPSRDCSELARGQRSPKANTAKLKVDYEELRADFMHATGPQHRANDETFTGATCWTDQGRSTASHGRLGFNIMQAQRRHQCVGQTTRGMRCSRYALPGKWRCGYHINVPPRPRNAKGKLICGARNRRGLPCQSKLLFRGGRCKFHGGLSTGPKTRAGRERALANLRRQSRNSI